MPPDKLNRINEVKPRLTEMNPYVDETTWEFGLSHRLWQLSRAVHLVMIRAGLVSIPRPIRDSILLDAAVAIRGGQIDWATNLLENYRATLLGDAAYLNLLGAIQELKNRMGVAREFYRLAFDVDRDFAPARRNRDRLDEEFKGNHAHRTISLGDNEIRAHRAT
ncbi:MAG TPA: hypothetical protein VHD56_04150 [Tepidisphaeraceae bacterium]|nr:hypothetical protein [Tepidisphaeraceae bacterium]